MISKEQFLKLLSGDMPVILFGCEESQACCIEFRARGFQAFSCDLKPCSGGRPEWHLQGDVFEAIALYDWDAAVFFPDCTYLTISANWCYKDQPPRKSGKLVGLKRREARKEAVSFFTRLYDCGIPLVAMENPIGVMSSEFRKPDQIIQPHNFGDDASKQTCLWLRGGLPVLENTGYYPPRIVNGKKRWGNQLDSGQNNVPKSVKRSEIRSKTYPGIAAAMAEQWGDYLLILPLL